MLKVQGHPFRTAVASAAAVLMVAIGGTAVRLSLQAQATAPRQDDKLRERADLLAKCGLDDWLRPVDELDAQERKALNDLISIEKYNSFTSQELIPIPPEPPAACQKLSPRPPPAPEAVVPLVPTKASAAPPPCPPACFFKKEAAIKGAPDAVRFVVLGDIGDGEGKYGFQQLVADRVVQVCAGSAGTPPGRACAFAVFLGDNLYPDGLSSRDDQRVKDEDSLIRLVRSYGLPAYLALGNHDWHPFIPSQKRAERALEFARREEGIFGDAHFYDFAAGPARLWALDSNYFVRLNGAFKKIKDAAWLEDLKAKSSEWKIVFGHHPYLSNGEHGNAGEFKDLGFHLWKGTDYKKFLENFVLESADLLLTGHDHNLQFYPVARKNKRETAVVVSGAAAKCAGPGSAVNTGDGNTVKPTFEYFGPGFTVVDVTAGRLTVEMHWLESSAWSVWKTWKDRNGSWTTEKPLSPPSHTCAK